MFGMVTKVLIYCCPRGWSLGPCLTPDIDYIGLYGHILRNKAQFLFCLHKIAQISALCCKIISYITSYKDAIFGLVLA